MRAFRPNPTTVLDINGTRYTFMPHPLFPDDPDEPYALEGGEATIFQMRSLAAGYLLALKVSKPSFRTAQIAQSTALLRQFLSIPGFALANRICCDAATHHALVAEHPALEYAVLMPWLAGRTWAGIIGDRAVSETYADALGLALATATAQALWQLEARHVTHGDIASSNIIVDLALQRIDFLDLDHLTFPNGEHLEHPSRGTPGYQHRALDDRGQWRPEGDRFAGAVLLTELLVWSDPYVRALVPAGAETLFQPHEVQVAGTPIWQETRNALWNRYPDLLPLFDAAWAAPDLAHCPELSAWGIILTRYAAQQAATG